jgi:two-component system NtrC family sensor kinase
LQQRTEELETLVHVGGEMNRALALDAAADSLLAAILSYLPTDYAFLVLLDDDQMPILDRRRGVESPNEALLTSEMLPGYVLRIGEALLIDDTEGDKRLAAIFSGTGCRSGIATPFVHLTRVLGVLALGSPQPGYFSARHLRVLRSIGEQAALAIRNAQLFTQLQAYAHNLESMVEARTAALQAAQVQLMRAERLAALGTLAAGIAHEINNPLQPLLTNLELAIEDLDANNPVDRELLDFAKQDVQRIKRIVSRLLDFARPAHLELQPTDINEIVEEVFHLAGKQLEHAHVKVNLQLKSVHKIMGSADQLKQVFLNLMVNAMDAMPNGGQLTVQTTETDGFVALLVEDTGVGIAPDELGRIFDPFFTTKAYGTGLGLSVSYSIIESHGGRIAVDSEVNQYTRFTIYLPVAPQT